MKKVVLALSPLIAAALFAVTSGWENVNPNRRELAPARIVWQADFSAADGFSLERHEGAEGRIAFSDGALTIEKTNDRGFLVLKANPFSAPTNLPLRLFADVNVSTGDYFYARAFLRVCSGDVRNRELAAGRDIPQVRPLPREERWHGVSRHRRLRNAFRHDVAQLDGRGP